MLQVVEPRPPGGLPAELPQMVISVEVAPAQPFLASHRPEKGVRDRKVTGLGAKSTRQRKQFGTVGLELNWSRASKSLLHFGGRRSALRPLRRHPQGNPLDDRSLEKSRRWTHGPFAEGHPVGIAKVTNHLMGRHFPPKPAVGRSDPGYASNNCLPIGRRIKRSH